MSDEQGELPDVVQMVRSLYPASRVAEESNGARALVEQTSPEHRAGMGWCAVLRRAVGSEAHVTLGAPSDDREGRELKVTLRAEPGNTATFGFGKAGAAAVLAPLLRSGALGRASSPDAVARALGERLAHEASVLWGLRVQALPHSDGAGALRLGLGVELGRERFEVSLWLGELGAPPLAESAVELPLFVAVGTALREELDGLREGDLWYPDGGWLLAPGALAHDLPQRALLGQPGSEHATWVTLHNGSLLLTGPRTTLRALCMPAGDEPEGAPPEPAWCVASVELGRVRMTARETTALRFGSPLALSRHASARLWIDDRPTALGDLEERADGWALRIRSVPGAARLGA